MSDTGQALTYFCVAWRRRGNKSSAHLVRCTSRSHSPPTGSIFVYTLSLLSAFSMDTARGSGSWRCSFVLTSGDWEKPHLSSYQMLQIHHSVAIGCLRSCSDSIVRHNLGQGSSRSRTPAMFPIFLDQQATNVGFGWRHFWIFLVCSFAVLLMLHQPFDHFVALTSTRTKSLSFAG